MTDNYNLRKLLMAERDKIVDKENGVKRAEESEEEEAEIKRKRQPLPVVKALDALEEELKGVDGVEIKGLTKKEK
jgi:hypothetical protein